MLAAGPSRCEAAIKKRIPQVVSVGACDMVNFGPINIVVQLSRQKSKVFIMN